MKDILLEELEREIWIKLLNGANKAKDPLKNFTISSNSSTGVRLRTVVLRKTLIQERELYLFTDIRSAKWKDWSLDPLANALFYDPYSKTQIHLIGDISLVKEGKIWEDAWNSTSLKSRKSYMTDLPPGTFFNQKTSGLSIEMEELEPRLEKTLEYQKNFGLVIFSIKKMEYLQLAKTGNYRAFFEYLGGNILHASWMIP